MRQQGVQTERSIKDLNTLAPCSSCGGSSTNLKPRNLHDTCKTADLSGSLLDYSGKNNNSSCGRCGMNVAMESCNSSFSDLAKDRSFADFHGSFTGSNSSLEWADGEAFPMSRSSSTTSGTPSTACSSTTADLSDFVVLSAFQMMNQQIADNAQEQQQQQAEDYSSEEESHAEEQEKELPVELDDPDDDSEQVLSPPPRDSIKMTDKRRTSLNKQRKQTRKHQAAEAAFCQSLARSGIDSGKAPRRSRSRLSFKHHPSPLLHRANSDRSAMTENDAELLKQQHYRVARSISRTREASRSRPPTTRGHRASVRDRSVSRDRSTATAPSTLEITLDPLLLGKALGDEESEEDDDPLTCPWFGKSKPAPKGNHPKEPRRTRIILRDTDESSRGSSKGSGNVAVKPKRERRRRPVNDGAQPKAGARTRRSIRSTKSGDLLGPRSKQRASMNDCSARSNPEPLTRSLEDRLHNLALIDASARSNPERSRPLGDNHHERRFKGDTKPTRPNRKSSKTKPAAAIPSLSSYLH